MADGLVERVMRWGDVSTDVGSTTVESRWVQSVHHFNAIFILLCEGKETQTTMKNYWNIAPGSQDEIDYNNLVALNPGRANSTAKTNQIWWAHLVETIFIAASIRAPGYSTPQEVRTKLGIAQQ